MKFQPLDRVLIMRSNGLVESWGVIRMHNGHVLVGAAYTGHDGKKDRERFKTVDPELLIEWQAVLPDTDVYRPMSDKQLDVAFEAATAAA